MGDWTFTEPTLGKGHHHPARATLRVGRKYRYVQYYSSMEGDMDFVVIVVTQDMKADDALSRRLFMSNQNIKKFSTKVVIQPGKVGLELPV
ncbi:Lrp/AsnC ligand binding domain-containing protein [Vibrio neptunius]|uniref:Lrp/AsnC ligand binding domain-containing protein n=1 Tax=Vibrio neptunius TaxID=170651 RepID=UPI001F0A03F4|nr:Lrp/AsnC ligand binding domain-containing protein [Vibrio neptunius]